MAFFNGWICSQLCQSGTNVSEGNQGSIAATLKYKDLWSFIPQTNTD